MVGKTTACADAARPQAVPAHDGGARAQPGAELLGGRHVRREARVS